MTATISSKGRIVLPVAIRRRDRIESGQKFEIERIEEGEYRLVRKPARSERGLVDLLLSCPEKGWFVRVESESTDALREKYGYDFS